MRTYSLNQKIWFVVGILSVSFILSSIMSVRGARASQERLDEVVNVFANRQGLVFQARDAQRRVIMNLLEVIARDDEASLKKYSAEYDKSVAELKESLAKY